MTRARSGSSGMRFARCIGLLALAVLSPGCRSMSSEVGTPSTPASRPYATATAFPDLRQPAAALPNVPGAKDAAVVVAIESYYELDPIPGARANADAWVEYFARTLQVPPTRIRKLFDNQARSEDVLKELDEVQRMMEPGGRLWFVFIGHGMADARHDGHLLMSVAPKKPNLLEHAGASLAHTALLAQLESRSDIQPIAILDACYSGVNRDGSKLVADMGAVMDAQINTPTSALIFAAASGTETAGWLPDTKLPAFSYLLLGGLRGWADADHDGNVSDIELHRWTQDHLKMLRDGQTPQRKSALAELTFRVGNEPGPDFRDWVIGRGGAGPVTPITGQGLENVDTAVLKAYADVRTVLDNEPKKHAAAASQAWCALAKIRENNPWQSEAEKSCASWQRYAQAEYEALTSMRAEYKKLSEIMVLNLPQADRQQYAQRFARKFEVALPERDEVQRAKRWAQGLELPDVAVTTVEGQAASDSGESCPEGMVWIEGGSFVDEALQLQHEIPGFCMDRTEVTVAAYEKCVGAGKCRKPNRFRGSNYYRGGGEQHPVNRLNWQDANAFCEFAGKRLPTEWEWEWAARGRDEARVYPWGDSPEPSCDRAIMNEGGEGCGQGRTWPVGSKPQGNSRDGLVDMAGNVWEWTSSSYDYGSDEGLRTLRGGSMHVEIPRGLRSGNRSGNSSADSRYAYAGVRCARMAS